jgi:hypothetical protein
MREQVEVMMSVTVEDGTYWPEGVTKEVKRLSSGAGSPEFLTEFIFQKLNDVHGLKVLWSQCGVVAVDDDSGYDQESTPKAEEATQ